MRDAFRPEGLPNLRGIALAKVQSANTLYEFASEVFSYCWRVGKIAVVENPANSFMWATKWFKQLRGAAHWHEPHACMYGSRRKKRTGLLSTVPLPGLSRQCNGQHAHLPWGARKTSAGWRFATASETAYPAEFCKAAARDIALALQSQGLSLADEGHPTAQAQASMAAQKQARKGRGQVGPPEFASTVQLQLPCSVVPPPCIPVSAPPGLQGVPVGSKLMWSREVRIGGVWVREVQYGVFHTPDAFLQKALKTQHPFDVPVAIDKPNLRAISFVLGKGIEATKAHRRDTLRHYAKRWDELASQEEALKASMHPDVRSVMQGKNLLLFKEMLRDAKVDDKFLFHDLVNGFRLTGELKPSGQFPPKFKVAALSVDEL